MKGCVAFHNQRRVPVLHALVNPSWHLTRVGAFGSAVAGLVFWSRVAQLGRWALSRLWGSTSTLVLSHVTIAAIGRPWLHERLASRAWLSRSFARIQTHPTRSQTRL